MKAYELKTTKKIVEIGVKTGTVVKCGNIQADKEGILLGIDLYRGYPYLIGCDELDDPVTTIEEVHKTNHFKLAFIEKEELTCNLEEGKVYVAVNTVLKEKYRVENKKLQVFNKGLNRWALSSLDRENKQELNVEEFTPRIPGEHTQVDTQVRVWNKEGEVKQMRYFVTKLGGRNDRSFVTFSYGDTQDVAVNTCKWDFSEVIEPWDPDYKKEIE